MLLMQNTLIDSEIVAARYSWNTHKSYRASWRLFERWATDRGLTTTPPTAETVVAYLAHRASEGMSHATINLDAAAIRQMVRSSGFQLDDNDLIRDALRGITRLYGRPQRQARPIDDAALATIRRLPDDATDEAERSAAIRDVSLIAVMSDGGLRISEAAALTWRDVQPRDDGSAILTVRRSKTDHAGRGTPVYISPQALTDLDAYRIIAGVEWTSTSLVWLVQVRTIATRIQSVTAAAGLGEGYSGHSPRIGMAVRMHRKGAPLTAIMRQGRWTSANMVARYLRNIEAESASQWLG